MTITIIDTVPVFIIQLMAECSTNTQWKKLLLLATVEVVITVEEVTTAGACASDYVILVRYCYDDFGNAASATQTIAIIDTTAPELLVS